jgi:lipoprotein-anchoring transpeptidase ErfK/SrfK
MGGGASQAAFAQESTSEDLDGTPEGVDSTIAETPTETPTGTPTETPTEVPTEVPTETAVPTETPVDTATPPPSETPTETTTPETPTVEDTPTEPEEPTPTATSTPTEPALTTAELSDIQITLNCRSDPELTRIDNTSADSIVIQTITSHLDVTSSEPFTVNRTLGAGKTVIYRSGAGATYGTILTTKYIYTNAAYENEGVTIVTSIGTISKKCPPKPPAPKPSYLTITISCNTAPEKTIIKNIGEGPVTLATLGTSFNRLASEPFTLNKVLNSGASITYQSGSNTTSTNRLTTSQIYTENAGTQEVVTVKVSTGKTFSKACPPAERWIEVNLSQQRLYAWEGSALIKTTLVSTGRWPNYLTPTGTFYVNTKYWSQTMAGCLQGECYYVPNVPYVQYFTYVGHAIHGAYWHNNFGQQMSHGCVNLPVWFSEWLYYWTKIGTRVVIHY